jgi:hypothetical protein
MTFSFLVCFLFLLFRRLFRASKNTAIQYGLLDGYPGHSPNRPIRSALLAPTLFDVHLNLKQPRTMTLKDP